MSKHKFDVKKLDKLNNPERIKMLDLNKIVNELQLPDKPTLVDIGTGTGVFAEELLNIIPNSKCYGLDICEEMINWVKENRENNLNSRLETILMTENVIPLPDEVADLVFMITVHHELDDSQTLLNDVKRVLKKNGKVLICDWKEGFNKHCIEKSSIINDLKSVGFTNIKEVNASEKLVSIIAY